MPLPSIPDYNTSIKNSALVRPTILRGGHPIKKGERLVKYSGGFCVVYPYQTATKKYAVRCWHAEISEAKRRTKIIAESLKQSNLPYFVGFDFIEEGIMTSLGIQPIVVMDWVDAQPLKSFLSKHIMETDTINEIAENFKRMVIDLHIHHFSHGDLQHGNIMVKSDCSLVLVDYDSMYVPNLKGMTDEIKGLAGYQHEGRWKNKYVSEKADYFSELIIYISLKALSKTPSLWKDLNMENTETLLFSGDDIKSQGRSNIFKLLRTITDLAPLINKLCEFMSRPSIEDLSPLEEAVITPSENISKKWKDGNGYIPSASKGDVDDPKKITSKWKSGNAYVKPDSKVQQTKLLQFISEKFKKIE